jgi:serine protease Do
MDNENNNNNSENNVDNFNNYQPPITQATTHNNSNNFKVATNNSSNGSKKNSNFSFGRNIFLPFASGIVGATLVVGTCFGIPSVKNVLVGNDSTSITENPSLNLSSGATSTAISLTDYSNTAIGVAAKVLPSIVGIKIDYSVSSFFGGTSSASASGSGIIISSDGYILTNNHVVSSSSSSSYYQVTEATKITVSLYNSSETYDAKIIGTDSQTDLAIIKIDATDLTAAELGDSDSVQVGEFAMAIGNPMGLDSSVTTGIVSAVNREVSDDDGNSYLAIQTDAAINSGNSGGALVNSEGKVIGINTLKLSGTGVEGIGFAIPISSTIDITQQLITEGKVIRPSIGIVGRDLDESTAQRYNLVVGVYVSSVSEYSAAEIAGIKIGDVITAADGTSISTIDELNTIKNKHSVGDQMTLTINRNGNSMELTLTLKEST